MLEAFFLFIGGIQPKTKILDEKPRSCPRCGLHQAYLKRVDHYLSIFFIPVLKVKTGEPVLICDRCARSQGSWTPDPHPAGDLSEGSKFCRFCSREFPREYTYCPACGRRL